MNLWILTLATGIVTLLAVYFIRPDNIETFAFKVSSIETIVVFIPLLYIMVEIMAGLQMMSEGRHAITISQLLDMSPKALAFAGIFVGLPNYFIAFGAYYLLKEFRNSNSKEST